MKPQKDIGYISNYLIHWAGRGKPRKKQAQVLSEIAFSCRLLLSPNPLFFDGTTRIIDKMTCFTDVPLSRTKNHCAKYSRFGIVFNKQKLMNKGAQPIFYYSHVFIRDMRSIYQFVLDQIGNPTLDADVLRALHRHFYFVKEFSDSRADNQASFYYEREWRIGEHCLRPGDQNKGRWSLENKLPTSVGTLLQEEGNTYFRFEKEDVAFLIVPTKYLKNINNPHNFPLEKYENLLKRRVKPYKSLKRDAAKSRRAP